MKKGKSMRTLRYLDEVLDIQKIFEKCLLDKNNVCFLQMTSLSQKRIILSASVNRYCLSEDLILIELIDCEGELARLQAGPLHFYCIDPFIVFKASFQSRTGSVISLGAPDKIYEIDVDEDFGRDLYTKALQTVPPASQLIFQKLFMLISHAAKLEEKYAVIVPVKSKKDEKVLALWRDKSKAGEKLIYEGVRQDSVKTNAIKKVGTHENKDKNDKFDKVEKVNLSESISFEKFQELSFNKVLVDERLFQEQRGMLRKEAHARAFVTLIKLTEKGESESSKSKKTVLQPVVKTYNYVLYDLSTGGLGLIANSFANFELGEKVSIIAIDNRSLKKPVNAQVVAIKDLKEDGKFFKIGIKFLGAKN
jgi:hypothetical protein